MASFRLLVLKFVREYIGDWGASPSYGEIAHALDTSRNAVKLAVRSLAKDHLLLRTPGPRGLAMPTRRDEAVQVLRALGWQVVDEASRATAPAITNPPLTAVPVLDYVPDPDGDGHGESTGKQAREAIGGAAGAGQAAGRPARG